MKQAYCTIDDLIQAFDPKGLESSAQMLDLIERTSRYIMGRDKLKGNLVPVIEAREFDGLAKQTQVIDPFISITDLELDGTALTQDTDFHIIGAHINTPHWADGPYTRIRKESGDWPLDNGNIAITAPWGLYYAKKQLVASTSLAAADTAEISLDDGKLLSPGMHLEFESEQLFVNADEKDATDSTADLAADQAADDDTITVDDATKVLVGEVIQIDLEDMKVNKRNTTTNQLSLIRGWNKTFKVAHSSGADVNVYRTWGLDRGVNGTTAAIHAAKPLNQLLIPEDIKFLAVELTTLAWKRSKLQFASKEIKADNAVYYDTYPKKDIMQVINNYRIQNFGG